MSVLTIGNFDGCHLGHQDLLAKAIALGLAYPTFETLGLSFYPRPEAFFKKKDGEPLLTTTAQKQRIFFEFGLNRFECLPFDDSIAQLSAQNFFKKVLRDQFKCQHLIVGEDFHFGKNREGNILWLREKTSSEQSFTLHVIPTKSLAEKKISSSAIRHILAEDGNTRQATIMLGRPYLLEGTLIKGAQVGRKIGFPTFNLKPFCQVLPKPGVYAGFIWIDLSAKGQSQPTILCVDSGAQPAVINIGYRPTVTSDATLSIEAHALPGFTGPISSSLKTDAELYDKKAGFYFLDRIRNEQKFNDIGELKSQIARDCLAAATVCEQLNSND